MAIPLTGDSVRLIAAYYSSIDPERMKGWVGLVIIIIIIIIIINIFIAQNRKFS